MQRSFWILWTYLTRPLMWVMLAAFIFGGFFLYNVSSTKYESINVGVLRTRTPIRTIEQLEQVVARPIVGGIEIEWGSLAHEQLDFVLPRSGSNPRHIGEQEHKAVNDRLGALELPENVVAIRTHSWGVDQAVIDRMGEITSLERLGFMVSHSNDPLDLTPLAALKNLEVLDLGIGSNRSVSLAPLMELPELKTLSLGSHQWISRQSMSEVAKLPALKTLYLPDVSENELAMAAIGQLKNSSSLAEIRIAIPLDQPGKLATVQAAIGEIPVGSSRYYPSRIYALIYAVWAAMVAGSLGLQLIGQFSLPMAQLAPQFQTSHQRVAWGWMFAIVVGLTMLVCWYGANWFAVASMVGMCVVTGIGDSILALLRFGQGRSVQRWMTLVGAATFAALMSIAWLRPILADEYLMGGQLTLPVIFTVIAVAIAYRAASALNELCRSGVEQARPLMLSMHDVQRASLELRQRKLSGKGSDSEAEMEPYAKQERIAQLFGYIALAAFAAWWFAPEPLYGVGVRHYLVLLCVFLTLYSVFLVGVKWWQRLPYVASMITRPPQRKQHVQNLFRGVGGDMIRLWPIALANLLFLSTTAAISPDNPIARAMTGGLLVASLAVICYATILWTLTIRSVWGVAILCFGIYFGVATFAAAMFAVGLTVSDVLPTHRVVIAALVCLVLAVAATIGARRYFQRLEWGRFI